MSKAEERAAARDADAIRATMPTEPICPACDDTGLYPKPSGHGDRDRIRTFSGCVYCSPVENEVSYEHRRNVAISLRNRTPLANSDEGRCLAVLLERLKEWRKLDAD